MGWQFWQLCWPEQFIVLASNPSTLRAKLLPAFIMHAHAECQMKTRLVCALSPGRDMYRHSELRPCKHRNALSMQAAALQSLHGKASRLMSNSPVRHKGQSNAFLPEIAGCPFSESAEYSLPDNERAEQSH